MIRVFSVVARVNDGMHREHERKQRRKGGEDSEGIDIRDHKGSEVGSGETGKRNHENGVELQAIGLHQRIDAL
jgi:hypothetical protein